ncbi:ferric reductase NAD binding domain-containing protein [Irpex rosettiformis]|uniref:Ferric reductase NAD binding domain-containing protein n=1 Tax=Irpex rosettiformis TaxID=378272 RepID=A0ACB8UCE1_9APHY|nr:ferric reductase NAD binding domain-containing protein [Irpex rosettiformis]
MASPLLLDATPSQADRLLKAMQQRKYVKDLWILLGSVIAFLTVIRTLRLLHSFTFSAKRSAARADPSTPSTASEKVDPEALNKNHSGKVSLRRLPAALASAFKVVAFRRTIPVGPGSNMNVTESLFVFGYIAIMLVLCFIDTEDLNKFFWEDRAAHLASCQLPLIVALAGKNNILSFFTGVSHEKLNILHRASARTCLVFIWIHALTRAAAGLPQKFDFTHGWMRWGAVGLVALTLTTILSVRPIRHIAFEFFLISHIILVGLFFIGGYLHAREVEFGDYIWPALVIWGFDRVLRCLRLLWNNRFRASGDHHECKATIELLSDDTVRLTLRRRFNWRPGQHAYVVLPTVSTLPTEAHPFTIASIPNKLDGTEAAFGEEKDVTFIIRGREGFTGKLREHAKSDKTATVPAFIDGPYGCPPDLTRYSTSILVAGGSGVSYTLPLLLDIVSKARAGNSAVHRVIFVWSVRDADHIKWISKVLTEALLAAQSTALHVEARLYITGPSAPVFESREPTFDGDITESSSPADPSSEKDVELPLYHALQITHGRPSIKKILEEGISSAQGPVSVDVAGPSGLSRSVAKTLASNLTSPLSMLRGTPSVTLHTETFGMTK